MTGRFATFYGYGLTVTVIGGGVWAYGPAMGELEDHYTAGDPQY